MTWRRQADAMCRDIYLPDGDRDTETSEQQPRDAIQDTGKPTPSVCTPTEHDVDIPTPSVAM
jgi:hypothetical protein